MKCYGRNIKSKSGHCCYVDGKPCKFLEKNPDLTPYLSCQLRRENSSWKEAMADPRYMEGENSPGQHFAKFDYKNCENYQCAECGKLERGEINILEFFRIKET